MKIQNLRTHFLMDEGVVKAVDGVDLELKRGQTLGLVGESGCGKSVTGFSVLQIVNLPGKIVGGQILYNREVAAKTGSRVRGGRPGRAQLARRRHPGHPRRRYRHDLPGADGFVEHDAFDRLPDRGSHPAAPQDRQGRRSQDSIRLLDRVAIPKAAQWVDSYPFQLIGRHAPARHDRHGAELQPQAVDRRRAHYRAGRDHPGPDFELMLELQRDFGMAVMMITHDLGVVAETCNEVAVMYLGEVVEQAAVDDIFYNPLHPYTPSLLKSIPVLGKSKKMKLAPIKGYVPDPYNRPQGCPFHPRCPRASRAAATGPSPDDPDAGWPDGALPDIRKHYGRGRPWIAIPKTRLSKSRISKNTTRSRAASSASSAAL